ncbi:chemotaxis-specific protein-glutamate methyltransferase CheB [Sporomusa sp.]|uniref:chemotaxis-specific protein-glutamate methyltransferase CheB n=1 Tax=Sporomusa sp. TaxID=2078658 RepID=UPI002D091957|nr:chemotaxis-specific protein-glutamate methyltransferase CheB [Sporomusa sp.]HWR42618.1 chemotaxis-specific protein-glutamate methyltransferase CheB [Sporomusa sp.]
MEQKLSVLVVNDRAVYRKILSEAVDSTGLAVTRETASNGEIALERLKQNSFDIILLDVLMPGLQGLETLAEIRHRYPEINVIMVSGGGDEGAAITLKALQLGALDFVVKPDTVTPDNIDVLQKRVHTLFMECKLNCLSKRKAPGSQERAAEAKSKQLQSTIVQRRLREIKPLNSFKGPVELIVIAASTGGPAALEQVLSGLPASLQIPVLVVQHMPRGFTQIMAQTLNKKCLLPVVEAADGQSLASGGVFIAPGGVNMSLQVGSDRRVQIKLDKTPPVHGVRPAADVLFKSVAQACKTVSVLAIILTGMGCDGREGVRVMKEECKCYCIVQSERTCVVYGMPHCVAEAGLADETVDLIHISDRIMQIVLDGGGLL